MTRPVRAIVLGLCLVAAAVTPGRAQTVTVGLFAPSAPFPSTSARVELASRLGEHVGKALGAKGGGKVFARAGDFAAAVKRGEVTVALVDPAYLANAGGGYTVLAAAVRSGDASHAWQLVAREARKFSQLAGKRVLVPGLGGHEVDFVLDVMLGGEVGRSYFSKIEPAPDTASALAALGLGKADAAIVPAGVTLPSGIAVVLSLPAISGPVLVSYGGVSAAQRAAIIAAASGFRGDATVSGLRPAGADVVRQIARRFAPPVKRGPLAVPAVRILVGDLVEGRTFSLDRTPATAFTAAPDTH